MSRPSLRPCSESEVSSWISFLDEQFGYSQPLSYGVDFAPLFEPRMLAHSRILVEESRIVSSGALYPKTIVTPAGKLRVGVIGAVATASTHRGQGYSSTVLQELIKTGEEIGLQGLVLWSDKDAFYEKLGFKPFGTQEIFSLSSLDPARKPTTSGELQIGWQREAVSRMYNEHTHRTSRDQQYWASIEKVTSCENLGWYNDSGVMTAYAAVGKGRDLTGVVHEWGGNPTDVLAIACRLREIEPNLMWLTHPKIADPVAAAIKANGQTPIHTSTQGLFHPLYNNLAEYRDPARLAAILAESWFWGLDSL